MPQKDFYSRFNASVSQKMQNMRKVRTQKSFILNAGNLLKTSWVVICVYKFSENFLFEHFGSTMMDEESACNTAFEYL